MQYEYARPRPNPPISIGAGLGTLLGIGATLLGAAGAKALIDHKLERKALPKGAAPDENEISQVLTPGATVGDGQLQYRFPVALNVLGVSGVEGPTQNEFPLVTQPSPPLLLRGKEGTLIPLVYLYAMGDGEVGFKVDKDALLAKGIAFDVEPEATFADGTAAGATKQVDALVTNLSPGLANYAMDEGLKRVKDHGDAYDVPGGTRDAFIRSVLKQVVPSYDWSKAPVRANGWDPRLRMLWSGVSLVAQLAYQRAWLEQG